MKFRYFELTGDELKAYLDAEEQEFLQIHRQNDILLKDHGDEIEGFRPNRAGRLLSVVFKKGKQPQGMVRADKSLPKNEVRPHAKAPAAAEWRNIFEEASVTVRCQEVICTSLRLPVFISGPNPHGHGMCLFNSRVGHVGPKVVVEGPGDQGRDPDPKSFVAPACMKELEGWEVEKLQAEAKTYIHGGPCYALPSKL
jgi:hypothetical protein